MTKKEDEVVAIAGATAECEQLWEVGIDVIPEYRNAGLGNAMVSYLTLEILKKNIVPFYSASVINIGSQMVASRAGYVPCWIDTFGNVFDEYYAYDYKKVSANTPEPIMPSQVPQIALDLRGLMSYAKDMGKKVVELTEEEKKMFIRN